MSLLMIEVAEQLCLCPLSDVAAVLEPLPLQNVVGCDPWFQGLAIHNGRFLSVNSLPVCLGLQQTLSSLPDSVDSERWLVLRSQAAHVAWSVNAVLDIAVLDLPEQERPAIVAEQGGQTTLVDPQRSQRLTGSARKAIRRVVTVNDRAAWLLDLHTLTHEPVVKVQEVCA